MHDHFEKNKKDDKFPLISYTTTSENFDNDGWADYFNKTLLNNSIQLTWISKYHNNITTAITTAKVKNSQTNLSGGTKRIIQRHATSPIRRRGTTQIKTRVYVSTKQPHPRLVHTFNPIYPLHRI